jgi:hypothetical protein
VTPPVAVHALNKIIDLEKLALQQREKLLPRKDSG